ncbi:Nucleotide-binding universal stress protein, UspA family [Pseudomonas guineae]|uniref:Nucleotide-binding universal stress protein, UspA family n=1 Tax=Pseudomonas guineae TaxID=425504 RepID=A0A1I3DDC9_9PSED|nr:universal stress protein [Pseudomonas guineae]SFH84558.1 Nucleotide-binding universal stress protein, UspA family [Pseudomonas guineae]|tara:strand:+ start:17913 stop:18344 length:432 start_codon:yes stop_codon:yes gene_type:complete
MRNVLIAFDGSDSSKRALQYVIDFAHTHNATLEVHLINVQHEAMLYGEYVNDEMITNIRQSQLDKASDSLEWPLEQLKAGGIIGTKHVALGNIAGQVSAATKQLQCDTVVMGTRGLGTFTGLLLGSVATRVIHEVQVPVLLVK